jgi:hypothetical protein
MHVIIMTCVSHEATHRNILLQILTWSRLKDSAAPSSCNASFKRAVQTIHIVHSPSYPLYRSFSACIFQVDMQLLQHSLRRAGLASRCALLPKHPEVLPPHPPALSVLQRSALLWVSNLNPHLLARLAVAHRGRKGGVVKTKRACSLSPQNVGSKPDRPHRRTPSRGPPYDSGYEEVGLQCRSAERGKRSSNSMSCCSAVSLRAERGSHAQEPSRRSTKCCRDVEKIFCELGLPGMALPV